MKHLIQPGLKTGILLYTLAWTACGGETPSAPDPSYTVRVAGALQQQMHRGDLSAQIDLATLQQESHLYALGALEGLKGEILIYDGVPDISYVDPVTSALATRSSFEEKASLLVYAHVDRWQEVALPDTIGSSAGLERYLAQVAGEHGLDPETPFPFRLSGPAEAVAWHVIDWPEGDTVHTPEKHRQSGLSGRVEAVEVELVGFYSERHQGIFTHHGRSTHLHVRTQAGRFGGHVDDLVPGSGMRLWLPAGGTP